MGADLTDKISEDVRRMKFPKEQIALSLLSIAAGFVHGNAIVNGYELSGIDRASLIIGPSFIEGVSGLYGFGLSGNSAMRSLALLERDRRIPKGASERYGCVGFIFGFFSGGVGMGIGMFSGYVYGLITNS